MKKSSTNRFYSGGHLGDLVCSLYAIMKYGGGEIYIGPHDHSCWDKKLQEAAVPLCEYQPYITRAERVEEKPDNLTYDFTNTWVDQKDTHCESTGIGYHFEHSHDSIASCGLKKRDLINLFKSKRSLRQILRMLDHNQSWLVAPKTKNHQIICHLPQHKICRSVTQWQDIFYTLYGLGHNIGLIGTEEDLKLWGESECWDLLETSDLLEAADYINSSQLFIGVSSCNNAIAEGLDQFRFIECSEAWGTEPQNERGWKINDWPVKRLITSIGLLVERTGSIK